jgi:hypothetical protein
LEVKRTSGEAAGCIDLTRLIHRGPRGAISLSTSSHLPPIVGSTVVKPVTLPVGREKLATMPLPVEERSRPARL